MVDGQGGRSDTVSPELRAAESELDRAYRSNPLMSATFGEAAWYFLAGCEEFYVREVVRAATGKGSASHDLSLMSDNIVNHAKWPLRWFRNECLGGTATPKGYNDASYAAAAALSDLSFKYLFVESAFTYASLGLFPLKLQGNRIVAGGLRNDCQCDAYDRLADLAEKDVDDFDPAPLLERISRSVRVRGSEFSYSLTPRAVGEVLTVAAPELSRRFRLPAAHSGHREHRDRFIVNAPIGSS